MTHSVSNKLIVEFNGRDLLFVTLRKDNTVVGADVHLITENEPVESIIAHYPEIYSEVRLIVRRSNFVTIPELYFREGAEAFYSLSYQIGAGEIVLIDKLEQQLGIAYAADNKVIAQLKSKFPTLVLNHEAGIILQEILSKNNKIQPWIGLVVNDDQLVMIITLNGKLHLCNSYQIKNNDELFYFVMLAIEQLQINQASAEIELLGEVHETHKIMELFENYVGNISLRAESFLAEGNPAALNRIGASYSMQLSVCG